MKKLLFLIFLIWIPACILDAQTKLPPKNIRADIPPDAEDLNVFQQWLRWNNPGSLLLDHLIKQAMDLYEIMDGEIAKLTTKSDWMNRQDFVRKKLM